MQAPQFRRPGRQGRQGGQHGAQIGAVRKIGIEAPREGTFQFQQLGSDPAGAAPGGPEDVHQGPVPLGVLGIQGAEPQAASRGGGGGEEGGGAAPVAGKVEDPGGEGTAGDVPVAGLQTGPAAEAAEPLGGEGQVAGAGGLGPAQGAAFRQSGGGQGQAREELAAEAGVHGQVQVCGRRGGGVQPGPRGIWHPGGAQGLQGLQQGSEGPLEEPRIALHPHGTFGPQGQPGQEEAQGGAGGAQPEGRRGPGPGPAPDRPGPTRFLNREPQIPQGPAHPARILGLQPTPQAAFAGRQGRQEQRPVGDGLGPRHGNRVERLPGREAAVFRK